MWEKYNLKTLLCQIWEKVLWVIWLKNISFWKEVFVIEKINKFYIMEVSVQNQFQGQYLIGASKEKGKSKSNYDNLLVIKMFLSTNYM